jgi:membrane fusion protein (multidrug efflux system)
MNHSHQTAQHKKNWSRTALNIIIAVFALSVLAYLGNYFFNFNKDLYTDDAQVQQLLIPVNARVSGYIESVRFKDFQWVKKGDTLVVIDNSDYLIQKDFAEAAVFDARAGRRVITSNINSVENNVTVSDARIAEVKARLWNAEKNYNRYLTLLQKESVTQQQFDQVKSDYDALKAQVETLERSRTGSHLNVQEASTKIDVNVASVKRAEAQLKQAELNLKYTIITAPTNGYVGRKAITAGQLVQTGQQVVNIVDNDNKWISANFKEKQIPYIKMGDIVDIKIDGIPNKIFKGSLQAFASATGSVYSMVPVDNATGNFVKIQQRIPVRIEFDKNTDASLFSKLKSGMNAVVNIQKPKN